MTSGVVFLNYLSSNMQDSMPNLNAGLVLVVYTTNLRNYEEGRPSSSLSNLKKY